MDGLRFGGIAMLQGPGTFEVIFAMTPVVVLVIGVLLIPFVPGFLAWVFRRVGLNVHAWRRSTVVALLVATILPLAAVVLSVVALAILGFSTGLPVQAYEVAMAGMYFLAAGGSAVTLVLFVVYSLIVATGPMSQTDRLLWWLFLLFGAPLSWPFAFYFLVHKPRRIAAEQSGDVFADRSTLWEVVDRLRYARTLLLAQFLVSWTVLLTIPVFAALHAVLSAILLPRQAGRYTSGVVFQSVSFGQHVVWSATAAAVLGVLFIVWAMRGKEWRCLARLGAHRAMPGDCETTHEALREIALAAGLSPVPALYLIPDDAAVNAVVLGRSARSAAVAVTTGMAYRCPQDLQRAVLAGLLSRFRNGGVGWTTVRYMLLEPISRATRRYTPAALFATLLILFAGVFARIAAQLFRGPFSDAVLVGGDLAIATSTTALAILAVGWILDSSFRKNHAALVLSADAEGALLLGEPAAMLGALKSLLTVNSWLARADGLSYLAFVDPSRTSTLDCPTALDRQRLHSLEELAFPSPPGSVTAYQIAPLEAQTDQGSGLATDSV